MMTRITSNWKVQKPGFCLHCDKKLEGRRRTFCSDNCQQVFHNLNNWATFRLLAFIRDKNLCQDCKKLFAVKDLEGHHIVEVAKGGAMFELENVVTLCIECHKNRHRKR